MHIFIFLISLCLSNQHSSHWALLLFLQNFFHIAKVKVRAWGKATILLQTLSIQEEVCLLVWRFAQYFCVKNQVNSSYIKKSNHAVLFMFKESIKYTLEWKIKESKKMPLQKTIPWIFLRNVYKQRF